jgi:hypothetical protein
MQAVEVLFSSGLKLIVDVDATYDNGLFFTEDEPQSADDAIAAVRKAINDRERVLEAGGRALVITGKPVAYRYSR